MTTLRLTNEQATRRFGGDLAALLQSGDCVLLSGDLGAGKTALARAMIQTLCGDQINVPSPTFTLSQLYTPLDTARHGKTLSHFDLYRVRHASELIEIGLADALQEGISLIEWPEVASHFLPKHSLHITLKADANDGDTRLAECDADESWQTRLNALSVHYDAHA